jgi:hypothetical protein
VRTCREETAAASHDDLEAACAAMRAKSKQVMDQLVRSLMAVLLTDTHGRRSSSAQHAARRPRSRRSGR